MDQISIMIVDDHTIFCEGLKRVLESRKDLTVVGVVKNGFEAIQKAGVYLPSVILMDVEMPKMGGIEATLILKKRFPFISILMLTMHANDNFFYESRKAGASGYILKDTTVENLFMAIQLIQRKQNHSYDNMLLSFSDSIEKTTYRLTAREQEVLSLVATGMTNKEISEKLYVSMHTIKNHLSHIFEKLNCSNRAEAVTCLMDNDENIS